MSKVSTQISSSNAPLFQTEIAVRKLNNCLFTPGHHWFLKNCPEMKPKSWSEKVPVGAMLPLLLFEGSKRATAALASLSEGVVTVWMLRSSVVTGNPRYTYDLDSLFAVSLAGRLCPASRSKKVESAAIVEQFGPLLAAVRGQAGKGSVSFTAAIPEKIRVRLAFVSPAADEDSSAQLEELAEAFEKSSKLVEAELQARFSAMQRSVAEEEVKAVRSAESEERKKTAEQEKPKAKKESPRRWRRPAWGLSSSRR